MAEQEKWKWQEPGTTWKEIGFWQAAKKLMECVVCRVLIVVASISSCVLD